MTTPALVERDMYPATNFGTMPSLNPTHKPALVSWWIGLTREQFRRQAALEFARMDGSNGAKWVSQIAIVDRSTWQ